MWTWKILVWSGCGSESAYETWQMAKRPFALLLLHFSSHLLLLSFQFLWVIYSVSCHYVIRLPYTKLIDPTEGIWPNLYLKIIIIFSRISWHKILENSRQSLGIWSWKNIWSIKVPSFQRPCGESWSRAKGVMQICMIEKPSLPESSFFGQRSM